MTVPEARKWGDIPRRPAVYAMYGGEDPRNWVAYVGIAGDLQRRLLQHFVARDSSVVTGASATGINIEHVRFVDWWESPLFADRAALHAAEEVGFKVLDPALRSRGNLPGAARALLEDETFVAEVKVVLDPRQPTGRFRLPRLDTLMRQVDELERRVQALEQAQRK